MRSQGCLPRTAARISSTCRPADAAEKAQGALTGVLHFSKPLEVGLLRTKAGERAVVLPGASFKGPTFAAKRRKTVSIPYLDC